MENVEMSIIDSEVVQLEFRSGENITLHRVLWKPFCAQMLVTDCVMHHGEQAMQELMLRWLTSLKQPVAKPPTV